ncbi:hypothetical protein [Bradyrhizobium sp.]|uniref:hypothetical protein n=1 Tax=Bradyrhizobium sp. TaxID=376 RepID=UPI003C51CCD2
MFDKAALADELQALKRDMSRILSMTGEDIRESSRSRADALADQVKAALNGLGETLGQDEEQLVKLISERPIASLASAFALGIVVGLLLRRHSR